MKNKTHAMTNVNIIVMSNTHLLTLNYGKHVRQRNANSTRK